MELGNVRQAFGLDKENQMVSVLDVARGKACDCRCPACQGRLVAKQGADRAWHFAHENDSECIGAAESALHMAAKQLIMQKRHLWIPAVEAHARHTLDDGRVGEGAAAIPGATWELEDARDEVVIGDCRVDILNTVNRGPVIIEIAVTHLVDEMKRGQLEGFGMPALEIRLAEHKETTWTWEALEKAVLNDRDNRVWLFHPQHKALHQQAMQEAVASALNQPVTPSSGAQTMRFRLFGVPVWLVEREWCLTLWSGYNERVNPIVKAVATQYGGRWSKKYRNWQLSRGVKEILIGQLEQVGASYEA